MFQEISKLSIDQLVLAVYHKAVEKGLTVLVIKFFESFADKLGQHRMIASTLTVFGINCGFSEDTHGKFLQQAGFKPFSFWIYEKNEIVKQICRSLKPEGFLKPFGSLSYGTFQSSRKNS